MLPPDLRRSQAGTCGCAHSPLGRRWGCRSAREQRIAGQLRPSGLQVRATEERPSHGLYLAEKSGGHSGCGSRGPLRAWRRAGGGWARREGSHRREVLVAAEPSQRSRPRAGAPSGAPANTRTRQLIVVARAIVTCGPAPTRAGTAPKRRRRATAAVDSFSPLSDGGAAFSGENDRNRSPARSC